MSGDGPRGPRDVLRVWTEDAVWIAAGAPIRCEGRDAIMRYFNRTAEKRVPTPGAGSSVRLVGVPIIAFTGWDEAHARSETTAFELAGSVIEPCSLGYYDDLLTKESGDC
ncbi:nuclear transport factor 2 family protein [Nocardia sp. NPDC005745]|uniref:nuclear transport factor 2 family protein n=1 Tax=Nocardia sp. NPDC005745 TaxID=3157061 RepID=UPI0033D58C61